MMNAGSSVNAHQVFSCEATICDVDIEPAHRNTLTSARLIASS